jgi:hypothetical protein
MSQSKQLALSIAEMLEGLTRRDNTPVLTAWAQELGVPGQSPDLYLALSVLYGRLLDLRYRVDVMDQPDRAKALYRGAIDHLAQFISPVSVGNFNTQQISQAMDKINLLHLLAASFPADLVPDVHPATLEELTKELEGLLESVGEADLDLELRGFIETSLGTLLMIMRSYRAFGPDGAARIYGSVAAELSRRERQQPPATKQGKSALKKALEITKKIGAVVIWTGAVTGAADKLLTDGTDIASMLVGPGHAAHGSEGAAAPDEDKAEAG